MAGRTDIRLFDADGLTLDPDNWAPSGVRGVDKVAQRFIYQLVTPSGTVPGRPNDGTDFVASVRTFRSEFDLFAAFAAAEATAGLAVRASEEDDDDRSEKYGWSRLSGVVIDGDEVTFNLSVAAADGSMPTAPVLFTIQP